MAPFRLTLVALGSLAYCGKALGCGGPDIEVPPTLDYYLQRLPAKSIVEVLNESGLTPKLGTQSVIDQGELETAFAAGPSPQLVAKIDDLLKKARQNYTGPEDVNLLQDFRDLAAGAGMPAEVEDYVKWRFSHRDLFVGGHREVYPRPAPMTASTPTEIDPEIKTASPALLPHWLYLKGALFFKAPDDTDSETYFDRVLNEFPNSARAESALFMKARCKLSQSVQDFYYPNYKPAPQTELNARQDEARKLFEEYLTKYPQGRYRNDVIGWLGGIAFRSGNWALAMTYYVQQIDCKDHPEDYGPAVIMIEKCLTRGPQANAAYLDEIAQHPPLALALTYATINFGLDKSDGWGQQEIEQIQTARRQLLPKLAAAVLAHKELY